MSFTFSDDAEESAVGVVPSVETVIEFVIAVIVMEELVSVFVWIAGLDAVVIVTLLDEPVPDTTGWLLLFAGLDLSLESVLLLLEVLESLLLEPEELEPLLFDPF